MRKKLQEKVTIFFNLYYTYHFITLYKKSDSSDIMYKKDILNKCYHILFFFSLFNLKACEEFVNIIL